MHKALDKENENVTSVGNLIAYSGTPWHSGLTGLVTYIKHIRRMSKKDTKGEILTPHPWASHVDLKDVTEAKLQALDDRLKETTAKNCPYTKKECEAITKEVAAGLLPTIKHLIYRRTSDSLWFEKRILELPESEDVELLYNLEPADRAVLNKTFKGPVTNVAVKDAKGRTVLTES
ncbi:hypothetical protein LTR56_019580 [Elasticomyces elasticus]|nr:hypothetical protein LTR56_019580 [Elasticomyces elasticus]KAK3662582.1 hypothetical protein LTR22_006648 [Elasticomyces elasticus]